MWGTARETATFISSDEHLHLELTGSARVVSCVGSEACNALSSAVRWLPHDLPLSRQNTGTEEHLRQPGRPQGEAVPDSQDADAASDKQDAAGGPSGDKESMERSQTGHLDSIAEQEAPHSNGDLQLQEHALENGHSDAGQDGEQYETLTFHVGGIFFLSWFLSLKLANMKLPLRVLSDTPTLGHIYGYPFWPCYLLAACQLACTGYADLRPCRVSGIAGGCMYEVPALLA